MNLDVNNLTPNQRLQSIYHQINSNDDYYFIRHALRAIFWLKNNDYVKITSCDVWECLDNMKIKPVNPRSMGLVFKLAKKNNLIVSTDEFSISRRIQANNRPVRVWRFAL